MATKTMLSSDDLEAHPARAAKTSDFTGHAFIAQTVAKKVEAERHRDNFHDVADKRYAEIAASGQMIRWGWADMRNYLEQCVVGETLKRPISRKCMR